MPTYQTSAKLYPKQLPAQSKCHQPVISNKAKEHLKYIELTGLLIYTMHYNGWDFGVWVHLGNNYKY